MPAGAPTPPRDEGEFVRSLKGTPVAANLLRERTPDASSVPAVL